MSHCGCARGLASSEDDLRQTFADLDTQRRTLVASVTNETDADVHHVEELSAAMRRVADEVERRQAGHRPVTAARVAALKALEPPPLPPDTRPARRQRITRHWRPWPGVHVRR